MAPFFPNWEVLNFTKLDWTLNKGSPGKDWIKPNFPRIDPQGGRKPIRNLEKRIGLNWGAKT